MLTTRTVLAVLFAEQRHGAHGFLASSMGISRGHDVVALQNGIVDHARRPSPAPPASRAEKWVKSKRSRSGST